MMLFGNRVFANVMNCNEVKMRLHQIRVGPVSVVLKRRGNRDTETDMGKERHVTI